MTVTRSALAKVLKGKQAYVEVQGLDFNAAISHREAEAIRAYAGGDIAWHDLEHGVFLSANATDLFGKTGPL